MFPSVDSLLEKEIARLPLRAMVALAARGARRAQLFFEVLPEEKVGLAHDRAVEAALALADDFVAGRASGEKFANFDAGVNEPILDAQIAAPVESAKEAAVAASIAAIAARIAHGGHTPHNVAPCVLSSLQRAAQSLAAAFPDRVAHVRVLHAFMLGRDFGRLAALRPGQFPDLGLAVDPTEAGPLGPLWPECMESEGWYLQGQMRLRRVRPGSQPPSDGNSSTVEYASKPPSS